MKNIYIAILILLSNWAIACDCSTPTLLENINRTDFIATAKILKITQDPADDEYHDIEVELIAVYKGDKTTKLKIWSTQNSSCSFFTPIGTTWLIFASYNNKKQLSFHYCSGSKQMDRKFDLKEYPGLDKKYAAEINLKLEVLKLFRDKKIMPATKTILKYSPSSTCLDSLKGYQGGKSDFTVIEITIENNQITTSVIKAFDNNKLATQLLNCIDTTLQNNTPKNVVSHAKTKQYLVYYFYPMENGSESFITAYDL